jgi:hypothetical protein
MVRGNRRGILIGIGIALLLAGLASLWASPAPLSSENG